MGPMTRQGVEDCGSLSFINHLQIVLSGFRVPHKYQNSLVLVNFGPK